MQGDTSQQVTGVKIISITYIYVDRTDIVSKMVSSSFSRATALEQCLES